MTSISAWRVNKKGENMQNNQENEKKEPVKVVDINDVRASIFETLHQSKDGRTRKFLNVSFGKRYQKDGEWKTSHTFRPGEIRTAIEVLSQVEDFFEVKTRPRVSPRETPTEDDAYYAEMNAPEYLETV